MYTAFSCQFLERRRKDYVEMMAHHIITIALVSMSTAGNELQMGIIIMLVHDWSDITVDLLKMFNYVNLDGPHGLFLSEIVFIVNLVSWIYFRLWLYPTRVLHSTALEWHEACAAGEGGPLSNPCPSNMCFNYLGGNALMFALEALHVWYVAGGPRPEPLPSPPHACSSSSPRWFYLFMRIAMKLFWAAQSGKEVGEEEYEGEDVEGEENELAMRIIRLLAGGGDERLKSD